MDPSELPAPNRPLLLLGRIGDSLARVPGMPALRGCFVVMTPSGTDVEDLAAAIRPTAVLLESSQLYLEGRTLRERFEQRSPDARVVFFDVDRHWALWIEVGSAAGAEARITPCDSAQAGEALLEHLKETAELRRGSLPALPLEKTA